jgi:hypothetical protein
LNIGAKTNLVNLSTRVFKDTKFMRKFGQTNVNSVDEYLENSTGSNNVGNVMHAQDQSNRNMFDAIMEADVKCYNCQQKGHKSFECKQPKKARLCYHCNKEGHRKYDCPDRKEAYEREKKERNAAKKAK